jgi:hypothetical protein
VPRKRYSKIEENAQISVAIEEWHRLHEWADAITNSANRMMHAHCWGCGAFLTTPHSNFCPALLAKPERYLVPIVRAA